MSWCPGSSREDANPPMVCGVCMNMLFPAFTSGRGGRLVSLYMQMSVYRSVKSVAVSYVYAWEWSIELLIILLMSSAYLEGGVLASDQISVQFYTYYS